MVKHQADSLDDVLGAISDPTRRLIVARLAEGRASMSELAEPLPMSLPAVMKHVGVLERAGLVAHRKEGRTRFCELRPEPLAAVDGWLDRYREFWEGQLDSLVKHFETRSTS
jgi:DNA-binding transcriptional ArsR family regulator